MTAKPGGWKETGREWGWTWWTDGWTGRGRALLGWKEGIEKRKGWESGERWMKSAEEECTSSKSGRCQERTSEYECSTFARALNLRASAPHPERGKQVFYTISKMFSFWPFHSTVAENATVHFPPHPMCWSIIMTKGTLSQAKIQKFNHYFFFPFLTKHTYTVEFFKPITVSSALDWSHIVLSDTRAKQQRKTTSIRGALNWQRPCFGSALFIVPDLRRSSVSGLLCSLIDWPPPLGPSN